MNARWLVGAAAWWAFSLAVWFAGDIVPGLDGPFERFALIVAAGVAWLAWELARARRSLKENEALLEGIVGGMEQDSATRVAHERGIAWDDPGLRIDWPVPAAAAVLSPRDRSQPRLAALREQGLFGCDAR